MLRPPTRLHAFIKTIVTKWGREIISILCLVYIKCFFTLGTNFLIHFLLLPLRTFLVSVKCFTYLINMSHSTRCSINSSCELWRVGGNPHLGHNALLIFYRHVFLLKVFYQRSC